MAQIAPQAIKDPKFDSTQLPEAPTGPIASLLRMPSASQSLLQSPWVFRCCWLAVLSIHCVVAFAFYAMAKLFAYIRANPHVLTAMDYLGDSLIDYFPSVIVISALNSAMHTLAIVYVLFWSARYRRLLFTKPELRATASVSPVPRQQPWWSRLWARVVPRCQQQNPGSGSSPPSSSSSEPEKPKHFEVMGLQAHDLELLVDIGLQTFQAHKISTFIARVWINRLVALVLVLNCWFAPFVHVVFRKQHRATIEIVRLVVDSVLDVVYSVIVPSAIFYPYYREFDVETQGFAFINYYSDVWYINAVAENQQFFVTSWLDFVSKMLPGFSLLLRLRQIKRVLMKQMQFGIKKKINPLDADGNNTRSLHTFQAQPVKTKRKVIAKVLYNFLLLGWGLGIPILHLHATTIAYFGSDPGCLLELRPWAATKYVCVVLEVSCTQQGFLGTKPGVQKIFENVALGHVQGLIFSHCPELEVPSELQSISKLQMLKIYNSTIAEWGQDAALTGEKHSAIQLLYISLTNMTAIPDGLLSSDFPSTLYDVELCGTNLSSLPENLHEKWLGVQYFLLELSPGITQVPSTLAFLEVCDWLSLSGNRVTTIPDDFFANFRFYQLFLHGNPLQSMPENLGDLSGTTLIGFSGTNVSKLPQKWLDLKLESVVPMTGWVTPLCESRVSSGDVSVPDKLFRWGSFEVDCYGEYSKTHMYPLEWEQFWRLKNR